MAFLRTMDISASGLTAERFRMDVIAENVANANTTRTAEGEPYRRRFVIFQEREPGGFGQIFSRYRGAELGEYKTAEQRYALGELDDPPLFTRFFRDGSLGRGVRATEVQEDQAPFKLKYDPGHPDAQEDGYVRMPNVDTVVEMVDMMSATRAYEANVTVLEAVKAMSSKALEI